MNIYLLYGFFNGAIKGCLQAGESFLKAVSSAVTSSASKPTFAIIVFICSISVLSVNHATATVFFFKSAL